MLLTPQALLEAWAGEHGGNDPIAAYRNFTEAGLTEPPPSPFREAFGGWALGSPRFVERLRSLLPPDGTSIASPEARQLAALDPNTICATVAEFYGLEVADLARNRDPHIARGVAARFGLSRPDSVPNLTRRIDARLLTSPDLASEVEQIRQRLAIEPAPAR